MDIDDIPSESHKGLDLEIDEEKINHFSKDVARAFFEEYGLIHHQITSYNEFITTGIQNLFDSLGDVTVEPGYEKKGEQGWRFAKINYGKVKLEPPTLWTDKGDCGEEYLKFLPRHARLQHMTYSSRIKVEVTVEVYTREKAKSDKFKSGKENQFINKKVLSEDTSEVIMGRIPVMVKSKLCWLHKLDKSDCHFDHGGYFIIKGTEKAFIAQEKLCTTRLWVSDKPWKVSFWPRLKRERVFVMLDEDAKVEGYNILSNIVVSFLYITIPVWLLFFVLGASSDKEILDMIEFSSCDFNNCRSDVQNILLASIKKADEECPGFRQEGKSIEFIGKRLEKTKFPPSESPEECISTYLFSTIGGIKEKALFLGYMVKTLLLARAGMRKCDNKDDFRNKRLDLTGDLLARELRMHIRHAERRMVRAMQRDLHGDRDLQLIERYLDASIITNGLTKAFSTGVWSHPTKITEKCSGVVATLRRTNPLQMISDLRKTRQQVAYAGKAGDARYPNPSYWGKLCFLSTPDGENCGLVKNLAVTGVVSSNLIDPLNSTSHSNYCDKVGSSKGSSSSDKMGSSKGSSSSDKVGSSKGSICRKPILKNLLTSGMQLLEDIPLSSLSRLDKVFLNGDWVGTCQNPSSFVTNLRSMRRRQMIHHQVEIKMDKHMKEVRIFSDGGRILRPLLIADNLRKVKNLNKSGGSYSFQSLLDEEIIEFIGVEEEEDLLTAWNAKYLIEEAKNVKPKKYTHCELDLSFLLGLSCSLIPFANHNFARRILFQSEKHSQQAIGFSTTNPNIRVDTLCQQMYYPQKPLFRTVVADCLGKNGISVARSEFFNGQNAIVAVNVHQGYNQEDSLVMNKTSLERGMFRTEHYKSYKSEVDNKELLSNNKRLKPKDMVSFGKMESKIGRIDSLDDDGFPYISASLQTGDIIIGKVTDSGDDHCVKLKHTEKGVVQKVVLSSNDEGKNFVAVTLRQVRSPCVGDKFSSMHGQKGVIGFLESQDNFPFTLQGIVPDIVINPHAFPTRQTPGQLLECALGKAISLGGSIKYATPFTTAPVDDITEQLHSLGFSRWGSERVYNGRTGEMMHSLIFMGPTFYQRLIHMAEDKMKFRNTGPVHPLTRQPVADRKRFGGVKFGEMERDCLIAHGAAANLHERLFTLSDFSYMHVCQTCKRAANVIQRPLPGGQKIRGPFCPFCKSSENIVKVNVPYGAKLLYQELFSMGICLTFDTEIC